MERRLKMYSDQIKGYFGVTLLVLVGLILVVTLSYDQQKTKLDKIQGLTENLVTFSHYDTIVESDKKICWFKLKKGSKNKVKISYCIYKNNLLDKNLKI